MYLPFGVWTVHPVASESNSGKQLINVTNVYDVPCNEGSISLVQGISAKKEYKLPPTLGTTALMV